MSEENVDVTGIQFEKDLKNAKTELARGEKSIKEHEDMLQEMYKLAKLWKEAIPVIANKCRKLQPEYGFETDDKYWEMRKQAIIFEQKGNYFGLVDKQIPHLELTIEKKKEYVESLKKKIARMEESGEQDG